MMSRYSFFFASFDTRPDCSISANMRTSAKNFSFASALMGLV